MQSILDPVILFFILGVIGGLAKSDLRIPEAFYETLSIYLLLAIGIKGGIELYNSELVSIFYPAISTIIAGVLITFLAYVILYKVWKFDKINSVAIATHYGSVSAVTYAVVSSFLQTIDIAFENFMTVLLVLFEVPAILVGIFLAGIVRSNSKLNLPKVFHELFFSKSILLLIGGLGIGYFIGYSGNDQLNSFFIDLFKGFLAIFMLEMGIVASARMADLKKVGFKLISFGLLMPLVSSVLGILTGYYSGLSLGGSVILGTLAASASYIAAPAAIRIALPEANPTYYLTAALGITFPFNIIFGIPIYLYIAELIYK